MAQAATATAQWYKEFLRQGQKPGSMAALTLRQAQATPRTAMTESEVHSWPGLSMSPPVRYSPKAWAHLRARPDLRAALRQMMDEADHFFLDASLDMWLTAGHTPAH